MNDLAYLSNEYVERAELLKKLNAASRELKRESTPSNTDRARRKEAQESQEILLDLLMEIRNLTTGSVVRESKNIFPDEFLDHIVREKDSRFPYWSEDLSRLIEEIEQGRSLSSESVAILDWLCEHADALATRSFRRLRRR